MSGKMIDESNCNEGCILLPPRLTEMVAKEPSLIHDAAEKSWDVFAGMFDDCSEIEGETDEA